MFEQRFICFQQIDWSTITLLRDCESLFRHSFFLLLNGGLRTKELELHCFSLSRSRCSHAWCLKHLIDFEKNSLKQICNNDPVKHLRWSFCVKIVNELMSLNISEKSSSIDVWQSLKWITVFKMDKVKLFKGCLPYSYKSFPVNLRNFFEGLSLVTSQLLPTE